MRIGKLIRKPTVVWFRGHDLRVDDHPALLAASHRGGPVVPLFIWDEDDYFGSTLGDMKRWWLEQSLKELSDDLHRLGVRLHLRKGKSILVLREFIAATDADAVVWNRCYETKLLQRDEEIRVELAQELLMAESFKSELLVEPWEISSSDSSPMFSTFHEYMRAWMMSPPPPNPFPSPTRLSPLKSSKVKVGTIDELELKYRKELGERLARNWCPGSAQAKMQLDKFLHDIFPMFGEAKYRREKQGSSRLSPHIRFGELSPRLMYHAIRIRMECLVSSTSTPLPADKKNSEGAFDSAKCTVQSTEQNVIETVTEVAGDQCKISTENEVLSHDSSQEEFRAETTPHPAILNKNKTAFSANSGHKLPHINFSVHAFMKNLCLRDYSYHVLFHHPDFTCKPIVPEFAHFPWADDNGAFDAWRFGRTGYPIVDAAMRELRQTGWIHNSMRFLVACFLTKYLLLPWTRGLKEFYILLLDGDTASNSLGWQWTSGSNTDSFPFSCLLNPEKIATQQDPRGEYVRKWVPELASLPKEYLHQPWKAPRNILVSAGVQYGYTYPVRIVNSLKARKRAKEAMLFMKQVFAAMRPDRTVSWMGLESLAHALPDPDCDLGEEEDPVESELTDSLVNMSLYSDSSVSDDSLNRAA